MSKKTKKTKNEVETQTKSNVELVNIYAEIINELMQQIEQTTQNENGEWNYTPNIESLRVAAESVKDMINIKMAHQHNCFSIIGDPFSNSIDLDERAIYFNSDIEQGGAVAFLKYIDAIFKYSGSEDDITIYINSPGGDVHAILGMVDIIQQLPCKVNTICLGLAASAALILFVSGTGKRTITKNSFLMYHNAKVSWLSGDHKDIKNEYDLMKMLQEKLEEIVLSVIKDTKKWGPEYWKGKGDHDYYIGSKEALKIGLATDIQ